MTDACIVGWAHSAFGRRDDAPDLETLMAGVARAAIEDAGIGPEEIDAGFVGVFGEGFTPQGFPASLVLQSVPELRFRPGLRHPLPRQGRPGLRRSPSPRRARP